MVSNYAKGKPLPLARYTLENDVKHAFSQPARGRWSLAPRALDGKAGPPEGAFYLLDTNTSVNGQAVDYSLRKGQTREILLVADLKKLGNPKPGEPREYEIKLLDDSGKTVAEHRFALERSDQRAFVEMALLDHAGNTLQAYDELRHPAGSLPVIDLSGNRQDISEDVPGRRVLFGLRLANRCDDGAGYADWRVSLDDPAGTGILNGDGVYCPLDAFVVADGQSGTLPDDPDADKRETALTVELDPRGPQFDRREPSLDLPLRVEFDKYEDGKAGAKKTLSWQITVRLALRHVPARRVLAIDFGTSAIAAVYDTDETLQVLPLARQVKSEGSTLSQHFEYPNPYFLSADASLASALGQPMRPNDSKFLDLPADANAAFKDAKTIIPSLKMLLVRNYLNLPINPRKYPYIDNKGTIENRVDQRPPLDEVLHGVFEQLRDTYINPSLGGLSPYTYLVATHPNTYTEVERRRFRKILQEIFAGQSAFHQLYEDNIHLLGESDAVLNYYLLHAASYHAANNSKLLEKETVFIWDIGAGTLDMTLATVERERQSDGGLAPKRIIIHDRYGVEAAGNLLTECIVRDLDQYLYQNIGDAYVLPLVKHDELPPRQTKTDEELFHAMAPLRTQIEQYKRALGAGKVTTATIQLAGSEYSRQYGSPISWQDTHLTDYKQLSDIKVAVGGNVDWIPNSNGEFISAFVQRVAESEVKMFLENAKDKKGTPIASIDTVIISGRTSLWPGLLERLRQTLPDVGAWIPLTQIGNHTQDGSRTLKNAVVSGAVFSQTRWKDIEREAPAIFGRYAIRYERNGKDDWHCVDLPESGEKELDMPNARICQVGISHAGRFKVEFEFPLNSVTAQKDSRLWLKMSPNKDKEKGGFRCSIKNAAGSEIIVTEETAGTMKPQRDIEVWPLTTFQLPFLEAGRIAPANKVL
jgi:hypothetical protein